VTTRARVQAGDEVLIWGIGGGVALAALQICTYLGAHVWVTSSNDMKLERARALGADETINHATTDVAKLVRIAQRSAAWTSSLTTLASGLGSSRCSPSVGAGDS